MTDNNSLKITIAGGSGMIGTALTNAFLKDGHDVTILTRSPDEDNHVEWDPEKGVIDIEKIKGTQVIINVCGAPIDEKRWTKSRKKELVDSRVIPGKFLAEKSKELKELKQYISVAGINCYGFERRGRPYSEDDDYGKDFTSQLVKQWEAPVAEFPDAVATTILRLGIVLTDEGGALPKMAKPFKMGLGSSFGSGDQMLTWVYIEELIRVFKHVVENRLSGKYNVSQANTTNKDFMASLAKRLNKNLLPFRVPSFVFRIIFGQMAEILLEGVPVSTEKLKSTGFEFETKTLDEVLAKIDL